MFSERIKLTQEIESFPAFEQQLFVSFYLFSQSVTKT